MELIKKSQPESYQESRADQRALTKEPSIKQSWQKNRLERLKSTNKKKSLASEANQKKAIYKRKLTKKKKEKELFRE